MYDFLLVINTNLPPTNVIDALMPLP